MSLDVPGADVAAGRMPRHDLAAERAVLGAILVDPRALDDVALLLRPSDFYRPAHQLIYEAILGLSRRGAPCDLVAVSSELLDRGLLEQAGGGVYLADLVHDLPIAAQATYYAKKIKKDARMRRMMEAGMRLVQRALDGDSDEVDSYIEQALAELVEMDDRPDDAPTWDQAVLDFLDELERGVEDAEVIPTPYEDLNRLLEGFRPGQLITIGARPGVGKSVVAADIARAAAFKHRAPVYLACLEMSRMEIVKRIVAAEARIPLHALRRDRMSEESWERVTRLLERAAGAPLVIDDSPVVTLTSLRASLRRMQRRADVGSARMLVVDYLQLMATSSRAENRQVAVSELSRGLKLIAKEFAIPVIMLSQLNRAPEQRQDKRPQVSDLRESGAVEQDSDVVILLHRDDVYDKESPRAGEIEIIVGKNRNGPTATVSAAFQGHYARVVDMAS